MIRLAFLCALATLAFLTPSRPVRPPARLLGLDRLYFTHVARPRDNFGASRADIQSAFRALTAALPAQMMSPADCKKQPTAPPDLDIAIQVCDFPLAPRDGSKLVLRQVTIWQNFRIPDLWWALYDHRTREDVWYFRADAVRTGNKALYNYEIDAASIQPDGSLSLRIHATMFRPQGAWWISEKALSFTPRGNAFYFSRVDTGFTISRDYDLGETPPAVTFSSERRTKTRIEIRHTANNVPDALLDSCGFVDPMSGEDEEMNWDNLAAVTACILDNVPVNVTYRGLSDPSFIERGGK